MEIVSNNEYNTTITKYDFNQLKSQVVGIYDTDVYFLKKYMQGGTKYIFNKFQKKNKYTFSVIDSDKITFRNIYVKSEINYYCKINKVTNKKFKKTVEKVFSILDLSIEVLNKKIDELSSTDIYKLYIAINTIFDRDIYIFNNIFNGLDRKNIKCVMSLINLLKLNDKIIIINDMDIDILYNYTDKFIIINDDCLVCQSTKDLLTDYSILSEYSIPMPKLVSITYLAKERKNIKLFIHNDVRDIMKDIYKHI